MRRVLAVVLAAFLIYFIAKQPTAAASLGRSAFAGLGSVAHGLGTFVANLASGKG